LPVVLDRPQPATTSLLDQVVAQVEQETLEMFLQVAVSVVSDYPVQ
jgi:hypothetical protein